MTFVPARPSSSSTDHTLYVVTMVSNPVMYSSRYELYREFKRKMQALHNVKLYTCEIAFGARAFEVIDPSDPHDLGLRTNDEIWHKENALNLMVQRLPSSWQYLCWADADIAFNDLRWADKTIHALQHYQIVQPWSNAADLGPTGEIMQTHVSFTRQVHEYGPSVVASAVDNGYYAPASKTKQATTIAYPHSGYAWAIRREAFEGIGGLPDFALCGSGDHHLAYALVNNVMRSYPGNVSDAYVKRLLTLQDLAVKTINYNIGCVHGTILHSFHGHKADRGYNSRWSILQDNHFDPDVDIVRDSQGLYKLAGNKPKLRDDLRRYFRSRNEDAV